MTVNKNHTKSNIKYCITYGNYNYEENNNNSGPARGAAGWAGWGTAAAAAAASVVFYS